jgi:hypothetical protein
MNEIIIYNEDDEFAALRAMNKEMRENRLDNFKEKYLEILCKKFKVDDKQDGHYIIYTELYGILDYYSKKNSLLIRKQNKWIRPALKWIVGNILK